MSGATFLQKAIEESQPAADWPPKPEVRKKEHEQVHYPPGTFMWPMPRKPMSNPKGAPASKANAKMARGQRGKGKRIRAPWDRGE